MPAVLRLYLADPRTGRRGLLIEVLAQADDDTLEEFASRLFRESIRVGLLMTPVDTFVVRDALSSMDFQKNGFQTAKISTALLFERASLGDPEQGTRFERQVRAWIRAVDESWFRTVPPDAVREMVPDVVGHMTGAVIEEANDRLYAT